MECLFFFWDEARGRMRFFFNIVIQSVYIYIYKSDTHIINTLYMVSSWYLKTWVKASPGHFFKSFLSLGVSRCFSILRISFDPLIAFPVKPGWINFSHGLDGLDFFKKIQFPCFPSALFSTFFFAYFFLNWNLSESWGRFWAAQAGWSGVAIFNCQDGCETERWISIPDTGGADTPSSAVKQRFLQLVWRPWRQD